MLVLIEEAEMERMTKKMAATKDELQKAYNDEGEVSRAIRQVTEHKFEYETEAGKKARQEAIKNLEDKRVQLWANIESLRARLEVETIAMLSGEDRDMAEEATYVG